MIIYSWNRIPSKIIISFLNYFHFRFGKGPLVIQDDNSVTPNNKSYKLNLSLRIEEKSSLSTQLGS